MASIRSLIATSVLVTALGGPLAAQCLVTERVRFLASDGVGDNRFGTLLDIDGDRIVVGATNFGLRRFVACTFHRDPGTGVWTQKQRLFPSNGWPSMDWFGGAVDIDKDVLLIGAPGDSDQGYLAGAPHAYFFNGSSWVGERKFYASDPLRQDYLGWGVAVQGDRALVGNEPAAFPGRIARGYHYQVPELGLYACPQELDVGDTLSLTTMGGKPFAPALLALVDLGGPLFLTLALTQFDANGRLPISAVIPAGLVGTQPIS